MTGGGSAGGSTSTRIAGGAKGKELGAPLESDVKRGEKLYTRIRWMQRRRRGHGHPEKEPAGSPLKKMGKNYAPIKVDWVEEKYDPPQCIEEDQSLVIPDHCGGPV